MCIIWPRRGTSLSWKLIKKTREEEEERNKTVQFGRLRSGIKGSEKQQVWKETSSAVSSAGVDLRLMFKYFIYAS